ncbi:MAG: Gfo/Idh/MocA family oxidoreductase [candidate division KSB1 bacterium]|nr:Gfo/Idh/MocA family oxidoreductase [candidate division KSB1 bacterium]
MGVLSRRSFIKGSAAAAMIVPASVLGGAKHTAPSEKLYLAGVGIGGVGKNYIKNVSSETIVALCDVDSEFAKPVFEAYPDARRFADFREMLDSMPEIDGVVIGTPDHTHAVVAMESIRLNKHVYCAKPLTRTVHESRLLTRAASESGVATQMSIQTNASEDHRILAEWIQDGAIGDVREAHLWSNRPIWPQGIERPEAIPSCPPYLDWNLWIGPAPYRHYHPDYHPFNFRGWYDFGAGALGDMGCHQFDPVIKALKLGFPESIYASSTALFEETFPKASIIYYNFPARDGMPPVELTWYDGGLKPERPEVLEAERKFGDWNGGILFIGNKGTILSSAVGRHPRIIPESKMQAYTRPPKTLSRSVGHYREWIDACKGGEPAGAQFGYGGPLTEVVLLGNIAVRRQKRLDWDADSGQFINDPEANNLLKEPYHNGWSLQS